MLKTVLVMLIKFLGSKAVKKAALDLLTSLAKKTDNKVDDKVIKIVKEALLK